MIYASAYDQRQRQKNMLHLTLSIRSCNFFDHNNISLNVLELEKGFEARFASSVELVTFSVRYCLEQFLWQAPNLGRLPELQLGLFPSEMSEDKELNLTFFYVTGRGNLKVLETMRRESAQNV